MMCVYKPVGLSPLQALEKFRVKYPNFAQSRLGYAGRLDPMAEGLLLVLTDASTEAQEELSRLDKTYEVECVFGLASDSYDALGLAKSCSCDMPFEEDVAGAVTAMVGTIDQTYPPYSAVRVGGHPLYWWARRNRLDEVEVPHKQRHIYAADIMGIKLVNSSTLSTFIQQRVGLVQGDFRQQDILERWGDVLKIERDFMQVRLRVSCSSGTYVRSLVHELGNTLGCGALALGIIRTHVGDFTLKDCLKLESD